MPDEPVSPTWDTVADRNEFGHEYLARRDGFADATKGGRWSEVFGHLADDHTLVNAVRLGSSSGYSPLHQAAWHGAPVEVVTQLLEAGAWRSFRTPGGERPVDIAREHRHVHLVELLAPSDPILGENDVRDVQDYLRALLTVRARCFSVDRHLRVPPVESLWELARGAALWCPVPGMYGGFALRWADHSVQADSWCRIVDGSWQRHRVTADGIELVDVEEPGLRLVTP